MKKRTPDTVNWLVRLIKWFYPGVGLKRWVSLALLGLFLLLAGATHFLSALRLISSFDWIILLAGLLLLIVSVVKIIGLIIDSLSPSKKARYEIADILYHRHVLSKGPRLVVIGGGSGQSVLLQGLKEYTSNITAIVTVADSGGSSGRLRDTFDILPPGDIRNCLVALADVEPLLRDLFQYRFSKDIPELGGHSFGNLFLTVLVQITGDFEKAIKAASEVLAIRGRVLPSTFEKVSLLAEYEDGSRVRGEAEIPKAGKRIKRVFLDPDSPKGCDEAVESIREADLVFLGPGSLYTSIIPNLLVPEITEALISTKAPRIYVCNVMTQKGETDGYSVYDHLKAIVDHTRKGIVSHCVVNTTTIPQEVLDKYAEEGAYSVPIGDVARIEEDLGVKMILGNVVDIGEVIRHNPHKIFNIVKEIFDL